MAAFVSQHPYTGSKKPLQYGIQSPQACTNWSGRDVLRGNIVVEDVKGGREIRQVSSYVCQASSTRPFKAMCGYGITNLLDGIVRNLKFVPVCVKQFSVTWLEVEDVSRV